MVVAEYCTVSGNFSEKTHQMSLLESHFPPPVLPFFSPPLPPSPPFLSIFPHQREVPLLPGRLCYPSQGIRIAISCPCPNPSMLPLQGHMDPPSCPEFNTSPLFPSHSCSPPPTSSLVCQQEFPSWSPFPINVICLPPDPDPTSLVITPCSQIPDPSSNPPLVLTPCSPPPSPPQSPRSPLSRPGCW